MKTTLLKGLCFTFLCYSLNLTSQTTENLNPSKDNSIYSETNNSNGQGQLFSGRTGANDGNNNRRALMMFDLTSIPSGATVTSVTLSVNVNKVPTGGAGTQTYTLHGLTQDWGEGSSSGGGNGAAAVAPDATWNDAMLGTSTWTNPGGDFSATTLSSLSLVGTGNYDFPSTNDFVAIVQQWIDTPSSNNGIILIGDETANRSARRFGSKDSGVAPTLNVTYNTLSVDEFAKNTFSIFPNPTSDYINISFNRPVGNTIVNIYDITGKEILKRNITDSEKINASNLERGIYLIKISSENVTSTKRFIKQ